MRKECLYQLPEQLQTHSVFLFKKIEKRSPTLYRAVKQLYTHATRQRFCLFFQKGATPHTLVFLIGSLFSLGCS